MTINEGMKRFRLPNPSTPEDLEMRFSGMDGKVLNFGDRVLLAGYYYNGMNEPSTSKTAITTAKAPSGSEQSAGSSSRMTVTRSPGRWENKSTFSAELTCYYLYFTGLYTYQKESRRARTWNAKKSFFPTTTQDATR